MRFGMIAAAAAALVCAGQASADTFEQTRSFTNQSGDRSFTPFDKTLGTLNFVTVVYSSTATVGFTLSRDPTYTGPVTFTVGGTYDALGIPSSPGTFSQTYTRSNISSEATFDVSFGKTLTFTGADAAAFTGAFGGTLTPLITSVSGGGTYPGGTVSFLNQLALRGVTAFGTFRIVYDYTAAATAVPEAGTWAMMILGFGMAGAGLRRRNRASAIAAA